MKRITSIMLVIIIAISTCVITSATPFDTNIYEIDNVTIIFEENSVYTPEEKQYIANLLVYGEEGLSTYGLSCLFGHKYVEETVTTITHCVRENQPRCLSEIFLISTCSRCGKTTSERVSFSYITCCP